MSAAFSAASAASITALNARGCASPGNARRTSSANDPLLNAGPMSPATPTCASSPDPLSSPSMSSAEVSPARTSASPARAQESTEPARVFGPSTRVSLASFDPATSSWKTSQLSLLGDSGESLEIWTRSGMTRNGTAYQLRPLAPLTKEIVSGSWPTPRVSAERTGRAALLAKHWAAPSIAQVVELSMGILPREYDSWDQVPPGAMDLARRNLLPTPMAADGSRGSLTFKRGNPTLKGAAQDPERFPTPTRGDAKSARNSTANRKKVPPTGIHAGDTPTDYVTKWPTPTARLGQARGAQPKRYLDPARSNDLDDAVALTESFKTPTSAPFSHGGSGGELHKQVAPSGGPLNPQWVAWLMGFPIDWLSLPPTGTRSSRRSRSGSARKSSTTRKDG
jgi:hypothetical protein